MTAAKKKPRAELSHERIRTVALQVIDREGLEEFSTRKLGAALGCEAMAIYWYYPNKDALLDAVVDELIVGIAAAAEGSDWIATLRAVAHAYRKIAHDHPRAFPLLATRRFSSESSFAFLEKLFSLAREQGIADRTIAQFYRVVSSYCSGFALNELATVAAMPARTAKKFERVAAVSKYLAPDYLDDMFEFGLELQLAALAKAA